MSKQRSLSRPVKSTEFSIVPVGRDVVKNWQDLKAVQANKLADAWDFLTNTPLQYHPERNYPLKGALGSSTVNGNVMDQWQYRNLSNGARIWFCVDEKQKRVYLTRVFTRHPNETK
ncbi:hypothetical protein IDM49_07310 [Rothia terrae]|uniref:Type II toxin-antitoxin system RelE/ParE family toxin n=1 Tax=Rothia terrae TaxID=396015 RepID=A0A7H2BBL6_9MICC|nr:hypothetical protein IDM49_07310 [Rothia terrae]